MTKTPFPVRKPKFSFASAPPEDWFNSNAVLTAFWDALSITFPDGETFFVRSVKSFLGTVAGNKEISEEIRNFIGQEAVHGKEHRAINKHFDPQGKLDAEIKWVLRKVSNLPPEIRLAITCAAEHFTAVLAEDIVFKHPHLFDKSVRDLWYWHAVEESEHKHVAYDLYEKVSGSYSIRVLAYVIVSVAIVAIATRFQIKLLRKRKRLMDIQEWKGAFEFLVMGGLIQGVVPRLFQYFKPSFHPNDSNTNETLWIRNYLASTIYSNE